MLQHGGNKRPSPPSCDYGTLMTLMQLIYADEQKEWQAFLCLVIELKGLVAF
jgi:hypothetical protein